MELCASKARTVDGVKIRIFAPVALAGEEKLTSDFASCSGHCSSGDVKNSRHDFKQGFNCRKLDRRIIRRTFSATSFVKGINESVVDFDNGRYTLNKRILLGTKLVAVEQHQRLVHLSSEVNGPQQDKSVIDHFLLSWHYKDLCLLLVYLHSTLIDKKCHVVPQLVPREKKWSQIKDNLPDGEWYATFSSTIVNTFN